MKLLGCAFLSLLALSLNACTKPGTVVDAEHSFKVALRAVTDGEAPLVGVVFETDSIRVGVTDAAGALTTQLRGTAGQTFVLRATCPDGYSSMESLPPLRLAHTRSLGSDGDEPLSVRAVCTKKLGAIAIVVHAPQGAHLPVTIDGSPHGTTDDAGNAHILLKLQRTVPSVRVALDTTSDPLLMPQHPSRTFELHGQDAILLFDQTLSVRAGPKTLPVSRVAPRRIPQRLD